MKEQDMSSMPPVPPPVAPPMAPTPMPPVASGVSPNRSLMIVLSYLWIVFLVPLLSEKDDQEVQWHAKNGMVLTIAEIIFWVAWHFITAAIVAATAGFGCLIYLFSPLIALGFLALRIMCIVKGTNGQRFMIPLLSDFVAKV